MTANLLQVATGQEISASASIRNTTGVATDPTDLVLEYLSPDGVEGSHARLTMSHPATGLYVKTMTLDQRGTYAFRFVSTNPDAVYEFHVTTDWRAVP